jgi:hypothetical protein
MEPLVAIYDACVLFPEFQRSFLIWLAVHGQERGVFRAKWTGRIHREWVRAVLRRRPDLHLSPPHAKSLNFRSMTLPAFCKNASVAVGSVQASQRSASIVVPSFPARQNVNSPAASDVGP